MRQMAHKNFMYWFIKPVDLDAVPTYVSVIARPVDVETIVKYLERGDYETFGAFAADVRLMWSNALKVES